jgi:hypothetical protein
MCKNACTFPYEVVVKWKLKWQRSMHYQTPEKPVAVILDVFHEYWDRQKDESGERAQKWVELLCSNFMTVLAS